MNPMKCGVLTVLGDMLTKGTFGERFLVMLAISLPVDVVVRHGYFQSMGVLGAVAMIALRSCLEALVLAMGWHVVFSVLSRRSGEVSSTNTNEQQRDDADGL